MLALSTNFLSHPLRPAGENLGERSNRFRANSMVCLVIGVHDKRSCIYLLVRKMRGATNIISSRRGTPIYPLQSTVPCSHLLYGKGGGHQYILYSLKSHVPISFMINDGRTPIYPLYSLQSHVPISFMVKEGDTNISSTVYTPMFPSPLWSRRGTPIYLYNLQSYVSISFKDKEGDANISFSAQCFNVSWFSFRFEAVLPTFAWGSRGG